MSEPKPVGDVVARVLRGLTPTGVTHPCPGCGKQTAVDDPGAQDGHCSECARKKRIDGDWHTPDLLHPVEQTQCPICDWHFELHGTAEDKQACPRCAAEFIPAIQ